MKKIKIIKSNDRKKVNGKWIHLPFEEWFTVVDIVEAENRTEVFNEFIKTLGKTWVIDKEYLTATREGYRKRGRVEQYTFKEEAK